MELQVTSIRYYNTSRGVGYECKTNVPGLLVINQGNGGATYLTGKGSNEFFDYTEFDLEDLIDKYETSL